jgi:hypothetical protein
MENDIIERKSNYGFDDCILRTMEKKRKINGKQFVGSTIVSTPMMMELATIK